MRTPRKNWSKSSNSGKPSANSPHVTIETNNSKARCRAIKLPTRPLLPLRRSSKRSIQNVVSVSMPGLPLSAAYALQCSIINDHRPLHVLQVFLQVAKCVYRTRHKSQYDLAQAVGLALFLRS